jgi:hypothetical protein
MALETARKYAREYAPGSGVFPGHFEGANAGGFEERSSAFADPCALAHPFSYAPPEPPLRFPLTPSQPHD